MHARDVNESQRRILAQAYLDKETLILFKRSQRDRHFRARVIVPE